MLVTALLLVVAGTILAETDLRMHDQSQPWRRGNLHALLGVGYAGCMIIAAVVATQVAGMTAFAVVIGAIALSMVYVSLRCLVRSNQTKSKA